MPQMSATFGVMTPAAPAETRPLGLRAVQAVYAAFVLSIPVETILYFQKDSSNPYSSVSLARVLGVVLFAMAAAHWRQCLRKQPPAFWLLAWYIAVNALSQLWIPAELFARFREQQATMIQMAALFLISVNLFTEASFRQRLLRLFGWWTALVALGMLVDIFGVGLDSENRNSIMTQDPNVTAGLLSLGALCIAGDTRLQSGKRRAWLAAASLIAVVVLIAAILQTGSRGGLIAFAAGFIALAVCGGRKTRLARVATAAVVLGLMAGLVRREFSLGTTTSARLERAWDGGDTAGRAEIYDEAWSMFLQRPLLGYGGANNRFVLGARLNFPDRDTHNIFLSVLTEVGLAGGFAFFGALLYGLLNGWRGAKRTGDALPFALICALLVINTSITGSREKIFWIVLAAATAVGLRSARAAP